MAQKIDNFAFSKRLLENFIQTDFCKNCCPQGKHCLSQSQFFGYIYASLVLMGVGSVDENFLNNLTTLQEEVDEKFTCPYNAERLAYGK